MILKKIILISSLFLLSLSFTGCIGVNAEFKSIRNDVLSQVDMDLKRDIELGIGPSLISLASLFVSFAETEEPVGEMMRQISKVQVGIYKKLDTMADFSFATIKSISEKMRENGWEYIVRSKDRGTVAAVFVRMEIEEDEDEITELFVISSENDELVLAHVEGDLTGLIDIVVREHGLQFEMAHN